MSLHHDPPSRVLCLLHVTCHITVADVAGGGHAAVLFWLPGARKCRHDRPRQPRPPHCCLPADCRVETEETPAPPLSRPKCPC